MLYWVLVALFLEIKSLIPRDALIGPQAAKVLQSGLQSDLSKMFFMHGGVMDVFGIKDVRVTRCGYTGEDGFEVRITVRCHFLPCSLACEWGCSLVKKVAGYMFLKVVH